MGDIADTGIGGAEQLGDLGKEGADGLMDGAEMVADSGKEAADAGMTAGSEAIPG